MEAGDSRFDHGKPMVGSHCAGFMGTRELCQTAVGDAGFVKDSNNNTSNLGSAHGGINKTV